MVIRTLVLTGFLAVSGAALAQSTDPAWLDDLGAQLAAEQQCNVEFYINASETGVVGQRTYEARAQCTDGRQFDGIRTEPAENFAISACGVQVC